MKFIKQLRFIASLATSLAVFLTAASVVFAQGYWADAPHRLRDLSTWDELCEIEDCDQFPVGYATYAIGPKLYYFPLHSTLRNQPPDSVQSYELRIGRFFEVDQTGRLNRSFGYASSLEINSCCGPLLEHFGLADSFPIRGGAPHFFSMRSAQVTMSRHDIRGDGHNGRYLIDGVVYGEAFWPKFKEVFRTKLPAYNDDFWLIDVEEQQESGVTSFTLISNRPLLTDRRVLVHCRKMCEFWTVAFDGDQGNYRSHFRISYFWFYGEDLASCIDRRESDDCASALNFFVKIRTMLDHLDRLFLSISLPPLELENR
ncbi:hypothetical protein [Yoonia sp. SS1-5]|uniref:Uncharacterized protein n=1 Tax=Yoonia rhodophyticola TaxID=3137370 RepID=A0AAN0MAX9_9RHOB